MDAVIYGLNESSMSSWRNLIWPSRFPIGPSDSSYICDSNKKNGPNNGVEAKRAERVRASRIFSGESNGMTDDDDQASEFSSSLDVTTMKKDRSKNAYGDCRGADKIELDDMSSRSANTSGSEEHILPSSKSNEPSFPGIQIRKTVKVEVEVVNHDSSGISHLPPLPEPKIHATYSTPKYPARSFLRE